MGIGDIFLIILLAAVLAASLHSAIKRRKKGGCGCGCEGCSAKCGKRRDNV